ncbi:MAG: hypothetical protein HGA45_37455, partial [Chloroflexales bacterium]|nr:hypothetical protein [Chloroflexales bacterium]
MPTQPILSRHPQAYAISRQPLLAAVVALLYFLCASASRLVIQSQGIALIWPANGLLLAALLLSDRRTWPGTLAAVLGAGLLANLVT